MPLVLEYQNLLVVVQLQACIPELSVSVLLEKGLELEWITLAGSALTGIIGPALQEAIRGYCFVIFALVL